MAAVIVAPLGALGWQSRGDDNQSSSIAGPSGQGQQTPATLSSQSGAPAHVPSPPTSSKPQANNVSKTTVTINGRQIVLSPDGRTHQVIKDAGGTTTLDVSISNNVSGNAGQSQSSNVVNLYSSSVTSVGGQSMSR